MTIQDTLGATCGRPEFVPKGWGYELIAVNNPMYCGKLLHFVAGRACSLHYHKIKHETFFLRRGKMDIWYFDGPDLVKNLPRNKLYDMMEKFTLTEGMTFEVPTGRVHQMRALRDCDLFEFSTQDFPEDSYRILKGD